MSVVDAKSEIAASRAVYFKDLKQATEGEGGSPQEGRAKRPSYVGISTSLNGYTPYASYRTDSGRRISPPLHLPNQRPSHLDSVALVLNQDGFQRSLAEFQETMRDITMGRPESSDMTDNARILHVQDEFFPTSHMKEVIKDDEGRSVTTITQFHSGANSQVKKNLVSKQIERLYGGDPFAQIRLTSPEHQARYPADQARYPADEILTSPSNGVKEASPDRKFSGGFFAKRFGVTKMKDHSTLKSPETSPCELKPLKVPAVFKLLRPEFREQLKQSSCTISMPDESGKERVIPIHRETRSPPPAAGPISPHASSRQVADPAATPISRPASERIIPITRLNGTAASSNGLNGTATNSLNGSSAVTPKFSNGTGIKPVNGASPVNGNSSYTNSNGRQVTSFANGGASIAAANGNTQPLVNGVIRRSVPTVIGFRNPIGGGGADKAAATSDKDTNGVVVAANGGSSSVTVPAKPLIIRKLSPLSPKHIVVPTSNNKDAAATVGGGGKPAPAPKPEHLMSPPLSPTPSSDDGTKSPASSRSNGSGASPVPPPVAQEQKSAIDDVQEEKVPVEDKKEETSDSLPDIKKLSLSDEKERKETKDEKEKSPEEDKIEAVKQNGEVKEMEREEIVTDQEYQMDSEYLDYNGDQYTPQYYGLRERELLCPILEEDNESTASGSLLNLQQAASTSNINNANPAAASGYATDDPLLLTEQGEVQDGHYFIKVLENEIFKFEEQICDFEEELGMSPDIPEESREKILSTVGLAKLLMAQKMQQFRGLCDKNIDPNREQDPFVPRSEDLAGFWDMVSIQVEQVHNKFADLQKLRSQGWKEKKIEVKPKTKKSVNKNVNKPIKPKEKSEAAKARDEARKKMLEAKKRMMKENKENKENSDLVIIM